jgi:hypothetical protein
MKKIINQAPIVRYRPFVSEKFFLFFGIELFQQNHNPKPVPSIDSGQALSNAEGSENPKLTGRSLQATN